MAISRGSNFISLRSGFAVWYICALTTGKSQKAPPTGRLVASAREMKSIGMVNRLTDGWTGRFEANRT